MPLTSTLSSPAAKLGAYAVVLALALGGGALVGAAVGPEPPPATTVTTNTTNTTITTDPGHDGHQGG